MRRLLALAVTILILNAGCITFAPADTSPGTGSDQGGQPPVISTFSASPGNIVSG